MPTPKKSIIGERYGRLTIIGENRDKTYLRAICRCDCGNIVSSSYAHLTKGDKISCGCHKKELKAQKEAEKEKERLERSLERVTDPNFNGSSYRNSRVSVGDTFWNLTAIEQTGNRQWRWKCVCGNERIADEATVIYGRLKSCGCLKKTQHTHFNKSDVPIGTLSHTLEFLGDTGSQGNGDLTKRMYLCRCNVCGKEAWYEKLKFKQGFAKCDCERLQERRKHFILLLKKYVVKKFPQKDFTPLVRGQRFGKLTVIKRTEYPEKDLDLIWYDCKCDCGNKVSVRKKLLLNGQTRSCGCLHAETFKSRRSYPDWIRPLLFVPEEIKRLDNKDINLYSDEITLKCTVCGKEHKRRLKYIIENDYRVPVCMDCNHRSSVFEETVASYVNELCDPYGIDVKRHVRGIIGNLEYDIYIPELNLAIECNGDYWHSEKVRPDVKYHYKKWEESQKQGIRLVQIFQSDWTLNTEKWKRFFEDLIVPKVRVYARNLCIRSVDNKEAHDFYNANHMQGLSHILKAGITYALEDKETHNVYCMMSFSHVKFENDSMSVGSYELLRFAVLHGHAVIGGASRLIKAFEREYSPKEIISYSDCDLFSGNLYTTLGFRQDGYSIPYFYSDGKDGYVKREQAQTTKLKAKFPELFEEAVRENAKSKERYVMEKLGFFRINRTGNQRWVKTYSADVKQRASKYHP